MGNLDRNGLEVLDRGECLRLLRTATVGRLAAWAGGGPVVLPVNYVLGDEQLVIGTAAGTKLHAAVANEVVAFEVDDVDPGYEWGWSVLVRGPARHLQDPSEIRRAQALPLRSWGAGEHRRFVSIRIDEVSGRRIGRHGRRGLADG